MARLEFAKGFEEFKKSVEKLFETNTKLFVYFTGEKNDKGVSWCPDCNEADPILKEAVNKFGDNETIFLTVDVGNRAFWKDMKNPFREDPNIKLMVIPTLIRWKTVQRLEGDHCTKMDLLEMIFDEV